MRAIRHPIIVERTDAFPHVPLPAPATQGSACFDLYAAAHVDLTRGKVSLVHTGLRFRPPDGTFLEIRPRSGLSTQGVIMPNAPATIDRDYAEEVLVPLTYLFDGIYSIRAGDRIGQIRLVPEIPADYQLGSVFPMTDRKGGFGSTGR